MPRPHILRRRYLVDWKLQGSLILHGITYGGLVLLAVSAGIFSPLLWDLASHETSGSYEEHSIVMLYLHERFWLLAAMCLVIVVVGAIRYSHRVAGPMVRFKRHLRSLANGRLPAPLRTRRTDFLKEEVGCLNQAVVGIGERVDAIRRAQVELRRKLTDCIDVMHERPAEMAEVIAACEGLEQAVRAFQYVDEPDGAAVPVATTAQPQLAGQLGGV